MMKRQIFIVMSILLVGLSSFSCTDKGKIFAGIQNGEGLDEGTPVPFLLDQNYPNPFSLRTIIPFQSAFDMRIRIKLLTDDWQDVRTVVNAMVSAGSHAVQFDASDLPSGEYYYTMEAKGITQIRKMKIIK